MGIFRGARKLIGAHRETGGIATIATYVRDVDIDFGIVETDEAGRLTEYIEKPTLQYRVSMGIYMLEPRVLRCLKKGVRLDFPDLIKILIANGEKVVSYPFSGYWRDIGRHDDYDQAVTEFEARKAAFLPQGHS